MTDTTAPDHQTIRLRPGSFEAFRLFGVPVYVHWSFLAGGLITSSFGGGGFDLIWPCCMAYMLLILGHESGHAIAARLMRLRVHAIQLSGLGGHCLVEPARSVRGAFFLYSSGLLVQLLLFAGAATYIALYGWPKSVYGRCIVNTFTIVNAVVFLICLVPTKSSDSAVLLKLAMHVLWGRPYPLMYNPEGTSPIFPPETSLLKIPGMVPSGFTTRVEILNDDRTPMDFVVNMFKKHLKFEEARALRVMMEIHRTGGILVPLRDTQEANLVADGIAEDCATHGFSLICRAVGAGAGA